MGTNISGAITAPTPNNQSQESAPDTISATGRSAGRGVQSNTAKCYLGRTLGYATGAYMVFRNVFNLCSAAPATTPYMPGNNPENPADSSSGPSKETIAAVAAFTGTAALLATGCVYYCYDVVCGKRDYDDPYAEQNAISMETTPAEEPGNPTGESSL